MDCIASLKPKSTTPITTANMNEATSTSVALDCTSEYLGHDILSLTSIKESLKKAAILLITNQYLGII